MRDFVALCASTFDIQGPIYEFGALEPEGQISGFNNLRPFFPGKEYVGCDFRAGAGVDRVMNLHHLDLPDNSVPTLICVETLEHVQWPWIAVDEMYRVLTPDGLLILSAPFYFPIHAYPDDYWRVTPSGMTTLLHDFFVKVVISEGPNTTPHTVFALASKGLEDIPRWEEFINNYRSLSKERMDVLEKLNLPESELENIINGRNYELAQSLGLLEKMGVNPNDIQAVRPQGKD